MEYVFFEGFFLQASLIFALGSQNIFIIEQAIFGNRPLFISFICFLCDLILIQVGVMGVGFLFLDNPKMKVALGLISVSMMIYYGISRFKLNVFEISKKNNFLNYKHFQLIMLAIMFSWLNPHAYLDAFLLIGPHSLKYHSENDKFIFGFGAAAFSLVWFVSLSYIARYLSVSLKKFFWLINMTSSLLFFILAFKLTTELKQWIVDLK